ncbi:hypothetical protein CSC94_19105 [Zhengella mangrovi]|uniref:Uncharacterized protein n=2 Tax=Zhengella mangrovi TaxID=1982044 RepID=A0A2G1QJ42_9HYPH|nr:hypothetical protein CSC94_19105 [Zhengella mangrovi]
MNPRIAAAGLALAIGAAAPASAQEMRFDLQRDGDRYVRLDRQTGAISVCRDEEGGLVCRMSADERQAWDTEVADLRTRVEALEKRLADLEGRPAATGNDGLPSDEEFEKTLGFMEKFMRRFMGIAKDLEKENGRTPPDRT